MAGYRNRKGQVIETLTTTIPDEIKKQFKEKCELENCFPAEVLRRFIYIYLGKVEK